jgi:N utilization substance protein A
MGGGTELALACRYRIAVDEPGTKFALPEVMLGIVPGWGGMLRLPERVGPQAALDMMLTGKQIDIMTEADESERRQKEFVEKSELFQTELDVDETLAQLLVAEGFSELEEVAYVDLAEIAGIEGFDEDLGTELQNRAIEALERRDAAAREERRGLGVSDDLAAIEGLTEAMLVTLGKKGVLTLDDLGDLATDELVGRSGILKDSGLSEDDGNRIIMAARAHWFADEEDAVSSGIS